MTDARTIRRILNVLKNQETTTTRTRIKGYVYHVSLDKDVFTATPHNAGDIADSEIEPGDHAYTHGGEIFRSAVQLCWSLKGEYRKFTTGRKS